MSQSSGNSLWRVDLLEVKLFNYLPRFSKTTKLLQAKNNQNLLKKLPSTKEQAQVEIDQIKLEVFKRKYHGSYTKLTAEIKKVIKQDLHKLSKSKDNQEVLDFLKNDENIKNLIASKLAKTIQLTCLKDKQSRENHPKYIPEEVSAIIKDKSAPSNPSKFFIDHCQSNKEINKYVSNLWNKKVVKALLTQVDWSFRLIRGKLTQEERNARRLALGKKVADSDDDDDDSDSDSADESGSDNEEEKPSQEDLEKFAVYDDLVAASDEEEQVPDLDPNINYNEITDEEPSEESSDDEELSDEEEEEQVYTKKVKPIEEDDFFAAESDDSSDDDTVEKKYNLPELTTGYISGGSDDENFNGDQDSVVKKATSQRKNRRGQRARQKIWEKKFGKAAKHKQKEISAIQDERKRKQEEFEERERKRQLRAEEARAPSGSNLTPIGSRKAGSSEPSQPEKVHPSWEAKKLAEEKLKNVKFKGKKITFD